MRSVLFVLGLLLFSFTTKAYDSYGLWCNGHLTLENGDIIEGEINYDLKFEVIQVRDNGIVKAFTAESVAYFTMFDPIRYKQRDFVSLAHQVDAEYERKTFFEIVAQGNITILRKSRYVRRPRITEDFRAPHIYLNVVCRHSYFAVKDKNWTEINSFETQLLPWMAEFEQEIEQYIENSGFRLKDVGEQMQVVNMYNQLCESRFRHTRADLYYRSSY